MAPLCCVRSNLEASPDPIGSTLPRPRHDTVAREFLPFLVFPPHSLLRHVFIRRRRSRREPTVHCQHLPGNVVGICAGKEHKRRRDGLRLGAFSLTSGRPRPGAGLHAVDLSRAEALSSGECNHGLEYANDLPADLLSVVLLEPGGRQEERFEHQPAQHQRAERPDDHPDIAGERGQVLVWEVAALLGLRLEQCDQPAHSGEIALQRTRILTVEECAGQRTPVGLVRLLSLQ